MKLIAGQSNIEYGLGVVIGAVDKKKLGEFSGSVLMRASKDGNRIELHATDMELFASITLEADTVETDGAIVLPAVTIEAAIGSCGAGEVEIESLPDLKTSVQGTRAGYEIVGLDPEFYPEGPTGDQDLMFEFPAGKLAACISAVHHAAGSDILKPTLCGINFRMSETGKLAVAACDGHRLSLGTMEISSEHIQDPSGHNFSIPLKAAAMLSKITATVSAGRVADQARLYFRTGSISICSAEGTKEFAEYRKIIPTGDGDVITVETDAFVAAMESCCVIADDKFRTANLEISDEKIMVSALGTKASNVARANVPCMCDCEPIKIRINSRYLIQALKSLDSDEVFIKYFGPASPLMLIPADHKHWDERLEIIVMLKA